MDWADALRECLYEYVIAIAEGDKDQTQLNHETEPESVFIRRIDCSLQGIRLSPLSTTVGFLHWIDT